MNRTYSIVVIFGLSLFAAAGFANAAKNGSAVDTMVIKLLQAIENNDLNSFVADGDDQFKAAITKQMVNGVNGMIAPRIKKGYEIIPLGTLNQQGCKVYLKKLVFKDGGDDILIRLALRDGKVAGFWFQ